MPTFQFKSSFPTSSTTLFNWHKMPGAFERLNPPWDPVKIIKRSGDISAGEVTLQISLGPLPIQWKLHHLDYVEGAQFRDQQISGPFKSWSHLHRVESISANSSTLEERIDYELPLNFAAFLGQAILEQKLKRLFTYRHEITRQDLLQHSLYLNQPRKHYLITGASGLVGSSLVPFLLGAGHQVTVISRSENHTLNTLPIKTIVWDPQNERLDLGQEKFDVVIHLSGENVASGIWTSAHKDKIVASRINGTKLLVNALKALAHKPECFISASAIGFYGARAAEEITEDSAAGQGFLSETCIEWERQALLAQDLGIRVVISRFGLLLSPQGGALKKMLPAFRLAAGAILGDGTQYLSWMHMDDVIYALQFLANNKDLTGPFNFVAPTALTNEQFSRTLGQVLSRPVLIHAPAAALRAAFGEFADLALLASTRVVPNKLMQAGFKFSYPDLNQALKQLLGKE